MRSRSRTIAAFLVLCGALAVQAQTADPMAKAGELYEKGEFAAAAAIYRQVARGGKQSAIAWFNYGNCMARLEKRGEAAQAWKKAIEWAPGFRRARLNLAILAEEDRDWAVATVQYRRLWELDPKDISIPLRMGEIQLEQDDPLGAMLWFDRALALDSASTGAWQGLVRAALVTRDTSLARNHLDGWERRLTDTTAGSWFALASLQEKAGSLEASRRSTERGLSMEPERVEGWLRLARLGQLGGNDATTIAVLRQAVARLDSEPRLWRALGQAGLRAGDGEAAYDGLSKAMSLADTEAPTLVRILADWHFRRGERDLERRARALLD